MTETFIKTAEEFAQEIANESQESIQTIDQLRKVIRGSVNKAAGFNTGSLDSQENSTIQGRLPSVDSVLNECRAMETFTSIFKTEQESVAA